MIIGTATWQLSLPGCHSLKEKRMVVKSLKDRIRHRFNVSVAETGDQDIWTRSRISVALVAASRGRADSLLDRVDTFIEEDGRALILDIARELF